MNRLAMLHLRQNEIKYMAMCFGFPSGSNLSVLVSENGDLVEVFPDGRHKFIKHLPPATPVIRGQKLERHL